MAFHVYRSNRSYRKSSIKPPGGLINFKLIWGKGEGVDGDGGLIWDGGQGLFNLEKMMVSVLHKELQYKMEKLKYKKVADHADKDQTFSWRRSRGSCSWYINHPGSVHTKFYGRGWLIQAIIY